MQVRLSVASQQLLQGDCSTSQARTGHMWGLRVCEGGQVRIETHLEGSSEGAPKHVYAGQQLGGIRGRPHPLLLASDWADHLLI